MSETPDEKHGNHSGEKDSASDEKKRQEGAVFKSSDDEKKYFANSYENVKTDKITITKDKLENILLKYLSRVRKTMSWITPASLFVTTLGVLVTTTFKSFAYVTADSLQAIFIILCFGSFIWMVVEIVKACRIGKKLTIDDLIKKISNNQENS